MPTVASKIVAITGTKGKTGLARLLDYVAEPFWPSVVRVETDGAYHNGKLKFSDDESRRLWGYATTNAPGRFLALHDREPSLSILEATLFSARTGLAYKQHDIGIFTNVYEDHIGSFPEINSKQDIARMKSFVFSRLRPGGYAIYNADDELVTARLSAAPESAVRIAVSLDSRKQVAADFTCTLDADSIVLKAASGEIKASLAISTLPWLDAKHLPSCYLALFAVAAVFAAVPSHCMTKALQRLQTYAFDPAGGRNVKLRLANGATLLMDYAHESVSLGAAAAYARTLAAQGKIIGVLRLAPSRSAELIKSTARAIYDDYDTFIIYDKVDGHFRQPKLVKGYSQRREVVGQTAQLFGDALKSLGNKPVEIITREDYAIQRAINLSCKGDGIVYIVGDNSARSRDFVEAYNSKG